MKIEYLPPQYTRRYVESLEQVMDAARALTLDPGNQYARKKTIEAIYEALSAPRSFPPPLFIKEEPSGNSG